MTEEKTEEEIEEEYSPETAVEWVDWFYSLGQNEFLGKADTANSGTFITMLKEEHDMTSQEIGTIMYQVAHRYAEFGLEPPRKRVGDHVGYWETIETYDKFGLPIHPDELEIEE